MQVGAACERLMCNFRPAIKQSIRSKGSTATAGGHIHDGCYTDEHWRVV